MNMADKRYAALAAFIVVSFLAAALGSAATTNGVTTWYTTIVKPTWNPPNWVFAPVWTTLYLLMSIAAWRAWRAAATPSEATKTLWLYGAQLVLNALWSVLFFSLHRPDLALLEIVLFLSLLITLFVRFARTDRLAAILWSPYVAWVSFASFLNYTIWSLNR
jgi:tryptophan-rich sensory protein